MKQASNGIVLLIFIFCSGSKSFAQGDDLDSLRQIIKTISVSDTAHHTAFLHLAQKFRDINIDSSTYYYNQLATICKKYNNTRQEINCYTGIGINHAIQGNYAETIINFNKGLDIAFNARLPKNIAGVYNNLGIVYKRISNYPLSLSYYSKSMSLYDSLGDLEGLASCYQNVGIVYDLMKEPEKAMEYYQKALQLQQGFEGEEPIANLEANIALIYLQKKDYAQAINYLKKSLAFYQKIEAHGSVANMQNNLGSIYSELKDFTQAYDYLDQALTIANRLNLQQMKASIYYNLAKLEIGKGNNSQALVYAIKNKEVVDSLRSYRLKAESQELLASVYEVAGDKSKALLHHKNYLAFKDSIYNENKTTAYKSQQVSLEVIEKDRQLAEQSMQLSFLNQQVKLENRWKWTMAVASLFLLATGTLYYQKYRQRHKYSTSLEAKNNLISRQKQEIEDINHQLETKLLRAQMNPHFIFNALSSIQHFITTNEKVSALHYLTSFSRLLRKILDSPYHKSMILKEEISFLEYYLELEALRFDGEFEYNISIDDELDIESHEIPMMVIQPFVENAIHHGLMPKKNNRKLQIEMHDTEDTIEVTIADNGIGREASAIVNQGKKGKSQSRGISVTSQRLELLAKNHGLKTDVKYIDLKDEKGEAIGTQVIINIPKQQ